MSTFYLDFATNGTGHAGTTGDPFSYTDASSAPLADGDTLLIRGIGTVAYLNFSGIGYGSIVTIDKWGNNPWRVIVTSGYELNEQCIVKNGIISVAFNTPLTIGPSYNLTIIQEDLTQPVIIYDARFSLYPTTKIYGCTIICGEIDILGNNIIFQDCIISTTGGIVNTGSYTAIANNCSISTGDPGSFLTKSNCQFNWTPPTFPEWYDIKESWSYSFLSVGITTPPQPGNPPYTGYENDPWGNPRIGIGAVYMIAVAPDSIKKLFITDTNEVSLPGISTDGSDILVMCIGGGGGGGFGITEYNGGGGGEFRASITPYTSKTPIALQIGKGGTGALGPSSGAGGDGQDTIWNDGSHIVQAKGGIAGSLSKGFGGSGGSGLFGYSGGDGGFSNTYYAAGGGGAGGPHGPGGNGADPTNYWFGGTGGGGNSGGSNGLINNNSNGGNGGNNNLGVGYGMGGTISSAATDGINGGGGGGGYNWQNGGNGSQSIDLYGLYGTGSGGGGAGYGTSTIGGKGGLYGGGGGGGINGEGAQGIIIIVYVQASLSASFTVDKSINFTGNMIKFDGSASTGDIITYVWNFDDSGPLIATSAVSANYSYVYYGEKNPSLIVYDAFQVGSNEFSLPLTINPSPAIAFSGIPIVSASLDFKDANGPYYSPGTIEFIEINFGDGSPSVSGSPISIYPHIFLSGGTYDVSISAFDTSGNIGVGSRMIAILAGNTCVEKDDYISLCGPENRRFGPCKDINLTNYLPDYLQESDVFDLVKFFEDFLNTMYSGLCGMQISETVSATDPDSVLSATPTETVIAYTPPPQNLSDDPRISILEKIKRLTDLHDPDLIDAKYLQFFASFLGYNVPISRNEIGGFGLFGSQGTVCSASDSEKYLRFTVSELPHWYKIKTTNNMILVMLYSFGLIGDIAQYYTSDYGSNFQNWKLDDSKKLAGIPDTWFPTPHFTTLVNIDQTIEENPESQDILDLLIQQGDEIIRAIESVRPINTVFHGLAGLTTELLDIWIGADARISEYLRVDYDDPADWWVP